MESVANLIKSLVNKAELVQCEGNFKLTAVFGDNIYNVLFKIVNKMCLTLAALVVCSREQIFVNVEECEKF